MLLGRLKTAALAGRALGRARAFAGGHGPTGYGDGPYRGIEPHLPSFWHTAVARGMGCVMWLWIFYRFKVDGKAFFVRARRRAARRARVRRATPFRLLTATFRPLRPGAAPRRGDR